jgi:hypothetical protein
MHVALTGEVGTSDNGVLLVDRDDDCVPVLWSAKKLSVLAGEVFFHSPKSLSAGARFAIVLHLPDSVKILAPEFYEFGYGAIWPLARGRRRRDRARPRSCEPSMEGRPST